VAGNPHFSSPTRIFHFPDSSESVVLVTGDRQVDIAVIIEIADAGGPCLTGS
jgi:hypothetical protein